MPFCVPRSHRGMDSSKVAVSNINGTAIRASEPSDMQIRFDWSKIYDDLVSQSTRPQKNAFAAAWQLENDIFSQGWPAGEVFGDQAALINRYGFSRATLREAVRLLEDRQVARMRPGPGGGLVILPISGDAVAAAVADYFRAIGVTGLHIQQARAALDIVTAYRQSAAAGAAALDAFTREFRGKLTDGPGAGLLGAGARAFHSPVRAVADCPVTELFTGCLRTFENGIAMNGGNDDAQPRVVDARRAQLSINRVRAHELARTLALELPRAQADGTQHVSTEDQLCERYKVGREVLRQALRVLESRGLIDCRRGRTHGVLARPTDAAAFVELVVAYFSATRLELADFFPVAYIISRIVRMVVAAESTRSQRQALLRRLDFAARWRDAPNLVTAQLQAEWSCLANPILIFMERCSTAYYARASASVWTSFDGSELRGLPQQLSYMEAVARGKLVEADSSVERLCKQVSTLCGVEKTRVVGRAAGVERRRSAVSS
jgi:DNA-binding FadR family transcriptional regulator